MQRTIRFKAPRGRVGYVAAVAVLAVVASVAAVVNTQATSAANEEGVPANARLAPVPKAGKDTPGLAGFAALSGRSVARAADLSDAVPAESIANNRREFERQLGGKPLPSHKVLLVRPNMQVIAFWNDENVCLRFREGPDGRGGVALCSDLKNASDPNTPMAYTPARGLAGDVLMLVPDDVESATVSTEDGPVPLVIENNVAFGRAKAPVTALSWTRDDGVALVSRPDR